MGVGCYAYWYRNNPSYVETSSDPGLQYPPPRRFDKIPKNKSLPGLQNQEDQNRRSLPKEEPGNDVCREGELKYWEKNGPLMQRSI